VLLALGARASGAEPHTDVQPDRIDALIGVLVERGVLEADEAERLVERNRAYESKRDWLARISLFGDFRGRYEGFFYDRDALGVERRDRERLRYRLRLGARIDVGAHADLWLRITTGTNPKSRNQTLGSGADFDPDALTVDQAWLRIRPFGAKTPPLPATRALSLVFGKMPNPFRSKRGADLILWDSDITPEGVALAWDIVPCDCAALHVDAAYYVLQEKGNGSDPDMAAVQADLEGRIAPRLEGGGSVSWYGFRDLDADFFARGSFASPASLQTLAGGNVPGGMSRGDAIDIGDLRLWLRFAGSPDWPVLVYGNVTRNFSAVDTVGFGAGKEDTAWSLGLRVGDKRRVMEVGAAWFWVEANAVAANFTDSDLFDGRTNGRGWFLHALKEVWPGIDLKAEVFIGDVIDRGIRGPGFGEALANHDRVRVRGDVIGRF